MRQLTLADIRARIVRLDQFARGLAGEAGQQRSNESRWGWP
jgi:hypothetical protein